MKPLQIVFVIIVPVLVVAVAAIFLYKPIRNAITKKRFREVYGKKVYKTALYNDYYLINEFVYNYEDNRAAKIDHVLFGNKYIYLIQDHYFDGSLSGSIEDKSLILTSNKGKKYYVDNPSFDGQKNLSRLTRTFSFNTDLFICITLVNPSCELNVSQKSKQHYIIQSNRLDRLVQAIESREIDEINAEQLKAVVQELDKYNKKGKVKRAKRDK